MLLYTDRSIYGFPETLKDLEDGIFDVRWDILLGILSK
jgi:hypothetical protein